MIRKLQKKLRILLIILLAVFWIACLVLFNWKNYQSNLGELKADVRAEIADSGWKKFLESNGESADLGQLKYCIFYIDNESKAVLKANYFDNISQEKLLAYGQRLADNWKSGEKFLGVTYISKWKSKMGRYVVLISGEQALKASMPVIIGSIVVGILGILLLVLAAKMLSDWLVKPIEEMVSSEKMFMSNASHELKTPLTVINANIELLSGEIGDNKHLRYIELETNRMISMVNKMLTLTRLDVSFTSVRHQKFCVTDALYDVIYPMESVAYEKKMRLDVDIQKGMQIIGDEEQVKSLMSILLDNAISYTPEGGEIQIEAGLHARKFCLRVTNDGETITGKEKEKLFERFFRKDEAREDGGGHFGLGLSIAESIVANHHGKIWVESSGGKNTFQVSLPAAGR